MKPFVYIAGPYTIPEPIENTRKAIQIGYILFNKGLCIPFVPHVSLIQGLVTGNNNWEYWLKFDLEVIEHMDALLRLPGKSKGADKEVKHAKKLGIPVFYNIEDLEKWIKKRNL